LISYPCLCCVKECQKLPCCSFWLLFCWFITLFICFTIFLLFFLILSFSLHNWYFINFSLYPKISDFLFIPKYLNRDLLLANVITNEIIILCIINMELMANCWSCCWSFIGNNTNFFAVWIDRTVFYMPNKTFRILEPTRLTCLLDVISNIKYSNIWWLCPNNKEITKNIDSHYFSLTFRECNTLLDLAIEIKLMESKITCYYDCISSCKHTLDGFLFNGRYCFHNKFIFFRNW